jgi:hypothetical protein
VLPGRYRVVVEATGDLFEVASSETKLIRLGMLDVGARFELLEVSGKRIGSYKEALPLLPGTYRVEVDGGPVFDEVVVRPGEVTKPR